MKRAADRSILKRNGHIAGKNTARRAMNFIPSKSKIRSAMRAIPIQQRPRAIMILYQNKILPQRAHRFDETRVFQAAHIRRKRGIKLFHQSNRLPKTPLQRAAGRARADLGQADILFVIHGMDVSQSSGECQLALSLGL